MIIFDSSIIERNNRPVLDDLDPDTKAQVDWLLDEIDLTGVKFIYLLPKDTDDKKGN
ncbi:MAG: hypothetical protein WBO10_10865 [Pyrinomonadaceae bacterium]